MWGEAKVAALLRRDGETASESTVGRILRDLMDRGWIQRVPDKRRKAIRTLRSRRPWAKRRCPGVKAEPQQWVNSDKLIPNLSKPRAPTLP